MKKRLLALLLCVMMLASLAVPAMATEEDPPEGYSVEGDVATVATKDQFLYALDDTAVEKISIAGDVWCGDDGEYLSICKPVTIEDGATLGLRKVFAELTANLIIEEGGALEVKCETYDFYTELTVKPVVPDGQTVPVSTTVTNNGEIKLCGLADIMFAAPCAYEQGTNGRISEYNSENNCFEDRDPNLFKYGDLIAYNFGGDPVTMHYIAANDDAMFTAVSVFPEEAEYDIPERRVALVNTTGGFVQACNATIEIEEGTYYDQRYYNEQVFIGLLGGDEEDGITITNEDVSGWLYAPCSIMSNLPLTIGSNVTFRLAKGSYNEFNAPVTVLGDFGVRSYYNTNPNPEDGDDGITVQFNDALQIQDNGCVLNCGNLSLNGTLSIAASNPEAETETNGRILNYGTIYVNSDNASIADGGIENLDSAYLQLNGRIEIQDDGYLKNSGRMENCGQIFVQDGGWIYVNYAYDEITYEVGARDDQGNELGWETAEDHVFFNRGYVKLEEADEEYGGCLYVGGALQNDGDATIDVCGYMEVYASASGDNTETGVINGSMKNFGTINIYDDGELQLNGSSDDYPYAACVVNIGEMNMQNGGCIEAYGTLHNYGEMKLRDGWIGLAGTFYNYSNLDINNDEYNGYANLYLEGDGDFFNFGNVCLNNAAIYGESETGYFRNDGYIELNGESCIGMYPISEDNSEAESYETTKNQDGLNGILLNNGELKLRGDSKLYVRGGYTYLDAQSGENVTCYAAILHNNGTIRLEDNSTFGLEGIFRNYGNLYNYSQFKVLVGAKIQNGGHLYVGDSATFGTGDYGDYNDIVVCSYGADDDGPIGMTMITLTGEDAEAALKEILEDELVYRIWTVYGPEYRKLEENFSAVKGCELYGNIVMCGKDYYGGWEDADGISVEIVDMKPDSESSDEATVVSLNTEGEEYGTFRLCYENWGQATLQLSDAGEGGNVVRIYEVTTGLNYGGFYNTDDNDNLLNDQGKLDYEKGKEAAVLGDNFIYNNGEQIYYMRNENGFNGEEVDNVDNYHFEIYPESGEGGEAKLDRDQYNWYHVSLYNEEYEYYVEYMRFTPVARYDDDNCGYDLLFEFSDEANEDFSICGNICDTWFNLNCYKPVVYMEDAVVLGGEGEYDETEGTWTLSGDGNIVAVAVKGRNIYNLGGYDLTICYPLNGEAYSVEFAGEIEYDDELLSLDYGDPVIDEDNNCATIRVTAALNDANSDYFCNEEALFTLYFKVKSVVAPETVEGLDIPLWFGEINKVCRNENRGELVNVRLDCGRITPFLPGDVLRDGEVDIRDAVRLLRAVAEKVDDLSLAEEYAGYIVAPGTVDTANPDYLSVFGVVKILNHLAKGTALCYYAPGEPVRS